MKIEEAIRWIETSIPGSVATKREQPHAAYGRTWDDAIEVETDKTGLSREEVESRLSRAFTVQHVFSGTVAVVRMGTDQSAMTGDRAMAAMSAGEV